MLGCNTAENITVWFQEVSYDFGITEQISNAVIDSASNMKKAFTSLPGYKQDEDNDTGECESEISEEGFENISIFTEELSFEHHACFAHMLQFVVKDGLKKAGPIDNIIKQCSKLVSNQLLLQIFLKEKSDFK